ncbi:MAG: methyltransferase domain-containing protein [Candidatus Korobacteraceae bacterium]
MTHRVCPWWLGYWLTCPLRRFWENPGPILAPNVHEGMTVLEPGPGMGYFTLELARLVGPSGRVIAVDVQPKMIDRLQRRAAKAGLLARVDARVASAESMGITDLQGSIDFTLAFAVVHEFPDVSRFFVEVTRASKAGATLLLAEPAGHVKAADFDAELQAASAAGLTMIDRPPVRRSLTALLKRN